MDFLRRALPQPLRHALKKRLGVPLTRLQEDWAILAPIGPVERPHVLFDVGSNEGWFFHCWKDWCPAAEVHAFEPQAEPLEASRRLYGNDPAIHLVNAAAGAVSGELHLNVMTESTVSSSFLAPVEATWSSIGYRTGAIERRTVPVITLDEYAAEKAIGGVYLLKIDVQGFELAVLEGATSLLARTDHVFVEAAIRPLYEGAPRFSTIFDFLDAHGFHLMTMRAWHRGNGVLVETDMLFRRNELAPPFDPAVDRIMNHI